MRAVVREMYIRAHGRGVTMINWHQSEWQPTAHVGGTASVTSERVQNYQLQKEVETGPE